jgi:hypothetical protein
MTRHVPLYRSPTAGGEVSETFLIANKTNFFTKRLIGGSP